MMADNPPNPEIIKNLGVTLDRHVQVEIETRKAERSRLVWYVAIAGYVLVNAPSSWRILLGHELQPSELLWLSAPWTAAALLGLLAHLATEEWFDRDNLQYYAMRGEIDRLAALPPGKVSHGDVVDVLDSRKPHLAAAKASAGWWASCAKWLRRATFITLSLAFVWTLLGPTALNWTQ
jgi:hypothetical protein